MRVFVHNRKALPIFFLSLEIAFSQVQKQSTVCVKSSIPPVHLECGESERIHVLSVWYRETTPDCQPRPSLQLCELVQETRPAAFSTKCSGLSREKCQVLTIRGRDTFSTSCNGRSSCWETFQSYWMLEKCGQSVYSITVNYECISDVVIVDVCSDIVAVPESKEIYMVSPNFFLPTAVGPVYPCMCEIQGKGLTTELLELYLTLRHGLRSNLTLSTDETLWNSEDNKPVAYNDVLIGKANHINIHFDSKQRYGQILWIRIKGDSLEKIVCNTGSGVPVRLSTPGPHITPRFGEMKESRSTVNAVPIVLGVVILILIIIIIGLLIYIIYRFREKHPSNYSIHRLEDSGISYIQYDYISSTSDLPGEADIHNDSYKVSPGLKDPRGLEMSHPHLKDAARFLEILPEQPDSSSRRDNGTVPHQRRGVPPRDQEHSNHVYEDIPEQDVDVEELNRHRVVHSSNSFLLQRD